LLTDNSAGFALKANPVSSDKNTIANGFDASYLPQESTAGDTHHFAALPKDTQLIAQSMTADISEYTLYLSAKISPHLASGDYLIRLVIDVRKNTAVSYDANGGEGSFVEYTPTGTYTIADFAALSRTGYHFASYNSA
jgi:hypothetical protein